ncbi:MAG: peptide-binding protein [Parafilimonas terrae]|nr:peptide-binding protein [Parafilimonas terrae]
MPWLCLLAALPASCGPLITTGSTVLVAPQPATASTRIPLLYGSERPLVAVSFLRADGGERRVLAWLNTGAAEPVLSKALYRELGLPEGRDLRMRIGATAITVAGATVRDGPGDLDGQDLFALLFAPRPVEAVLPASILSRFMVVIDPADRTLTLAAPGSLKPAGIPVPIRVDPASGIAVVEARTGEMVLPLVLDAGAPYTWLRSSAVAGVLRSHPEAYRADGAVGSSNLAMADLGLERSGTLVRLPDLSLGGLVLSGVGALGTGPVLGAAAEALVGEVFWDVWERAAPVPVAGWLGGNVLADFKLTIDYAAGLSYWQRQRLGDLHDLDGIGVTLIRRGGDYVIGRVAERSGRRLVEGVEPGDQLVAVDGRALRETPPEWVWAALHGRVGTIRHLDLARGGRPFRIEATAVPF